MAYSLVSPNTFALKLKIHCKICEKNLRNMLLKIQGVHSVKIDEKLGHLVISGTVEPTTILEKLGRKAELIWAQGQPINVKTITQSKVINSLNDSDVIMTRQLEQLSRIPGLQTMEVTTTIRLTIQGEESRNDASDRKILEISSINNLNKHVHQVDHSHGDGGFCAASSSCCGGHGDNFYGCCHGVNASENYCWGRAVEQPSGSLPPPPALTQPSWSSGSSIASAPPLPSDYYYHAPPSSSMHHTYYSALSDENVNGCVIQ